MTGIRVRLVPAHFVQSEKVSLLPSVRGDSSALGRTKLGRWVKFDGNGVDPVGRELVRVAEGPK